MNKDRAKRHLRSAINIPGNDTGLTVIDIETLQEALKWADSPQHGRWEYIESKDWHGGGVTMCSNCQCGYACGSYHEVEEFNYCPTCGARMEREE